MAGGLRGPAVARKPGRRRRRAQPGASSRFSRTSWDCRPWRAATTPARSRGFSPPSIWMPAWCPPYLNLGDIYARDDKLAQAADVWEQVIDKAPERAYLDVRSAGHGVRKARHAGAVPAALPAADRGQPAGLARAAGAGAAPGSHETTQLRRSSCFSRRWCTIRTR